MLQLRGLYNNRDARFSPLMSPVGGGRDMMSPLARMGRRTPYDLMRGGSYPGGIWGGRGPMGRDLFSSPLYGSHGMIGRDLRDPPLGHPFQRGRYPRDFDPRQSLNAMRRMPYDLYYEDRWPHGSDYDTCWRERMYHQDQSHHGHDCRCRRSCGESSNSNYKKDFDFKTKDVTVRGKARAIRASFLADSSKFEADLVKYLEKKKEEDVPDRVVDMLISFINREEYTNNDILDEVILNILASNVGVKSAGEYSLSRLKKFEGDINHTVLCNVITLITQSSKVDDGLKKWLEKYLKSDDGRAYLCLERSGAFYTLENSRPEVVADVQRMVGLRASGEDEFRNPL